MNQPFNQDQLQPAKLELYNYWLFKRGTSGRSPGVIVNLTGRNLNFVEGTATYFGKVTSRQAGVWVVSIEKIE